MADSSDVVGKRGLLTAPITSQNSSGSLMLEIRGGSEEFIAISQVVIAKNIEVEVLAYYPPRTVAVVPVSMIPPAKTTPKEQTNTNSPSQ